MPTERVGFLGIEFDLIPMKAVIERLASITERSPFSYVVTPNIDHVVMINGDAALKLPYVRAAICSCDSRILKRLARMAGVELPLVPGSDLNRLLFQHVLRTGDRILIVGGNDALLASLQAKYPSLQFVHHIPPMGLSNNPLARQAAAQFIASSNARFTFIAVGAPQQELIAAKTLEYPEATGMALCVGASLEFLTGQQRRAPKFFQLLGLEWLHRLAGNPRRLWRRYLVDDMKVLPIFIRSFPVQTWIKGLAVAILSLGLASLAAYAWSNIRSAPRLRQDSISPGQTAPKPIVINLPPPDLVRQLSPAEAGKENAERPFVPRPDNPASIFRISASAAGKANALTCLSQAIYYEAASEGIDGGRAVAQIILNRVRHPAFPSSVCGVVYQGSDRPTGCQFSFTCDGSLLRPPVPALFQRSRKIAEKALAGDVFAPVGHSTHFHADYVLPYWADSLDKTTQIGRHIFYRLRGSLGDARLFRKAYGGIEIIPVPVSLTQTLPILFGDKGNGASDVVAQEVARQSELAAGAVAAEGKPIADNTNGTLLADELLTPHMSIPRRSVTCSQTPDTTQTKPLSAEKFQPGAEPEGC